MKKRLLAIKKFYIKKGLLGPRLASALRQDKEFQRLLFLWRRERELLKQVKKKKEGELHRFYAQEENVLLVDNKLIAESWGEKMDRKADNFFLLPGQDI